MGTALMILQVRRVPPAGFNDRPRGRWEFTLRCEPGCPSRHPGPGGFSGHAIASAAAGRARMAYRAIDGTTGGVVVAARAGESPYRMASQCPPWKNGSWN